jgi:antitoxin (DNA-binding transcriptional repressor) of toxin-antitoxin stability system
MSVFLRWGVFGILGVAALLYAYNASKRLAEAHAGEAPAVEAEPASQPETETPDDEPVADVVPAPSPAEPASAAPAHCEAELVVAQRALDMKKQGEPLDRVLRMQEIAWQEAPQRRERLEKVATRWYGYEGSFQPEALRIAVISDCRQVGPAP